MNAEAIPRTTPRAIAQVVADEVVNIAFRMFPQTIQPCRRD
jgi:hypothetical protein